MPGPDDTPSAPVAPTIVDLDAGGRFGSEGVELLRPFKFKGMTYQRITFRVPTGLDLAKHTGPRGIDDLALMCDLAELSQDVLNAMYAGDRNRIDLAVGKHLAGIPATSTPASSTSASPSPSAIAS